MDFTFIVAVTHEKVNAPREKEREAAQMRIDAEQYSGVCACGSEHRMETRFCVIGTGVLSGLEDFLAEASLTGRRCAVYDAHTYEAKNLRRPRAEQEIVLSPDHLHANERSTAEVLQRLHGDTAVLIAVGGGTVHDIVRYCAKQRGIPFVSVPTAASCDGFCSNVASMTWEGYKNTMPCGAPVLAAADLSVICEAPRYLTNSGIGDMIGKFTALADWRIAHAAAGEVVCERIERVMQEALAQVWDHALEIREGVPESYEAVTYGLLMSGLAIQMLGTSRPASGGEHHISHLIEMEPAGLGVRSEALHGEKVGVGTILASGEYHRLAEIQDLTAEALPYRPIDQTALRDFFGPDLYPVAQRENQRDCLATVTEDALIRAWPRIREIVARIPAAEEIESRLRALGAKHTLEDIGVPEEKRDVLLEYSPLVRNRLTLMRIRRMIRGTEAGFGFHS